MTTPTWPLGQPQCVHDWRLIDENPIREPKKRTDHDYPSHGFSLIPPPSVFYRTAGTKRRWYCTKCRLTDTTEERNNPMVSILNRLNAADQNLTNLADDSNYNDSQFETFVNIAREAIDAARRIAEREETETR